MGSLEEELPWDGVTCVQFLLYHFSWYPLGQMPSVTVGLLRAAPGCCFRHSVLSWIRGKSLWKSQFSKPKKPSNTSLSVVYYELQTKIQPFCCRKAKHYWISRQSSHMQDKHGFGGSFFTSNSWAVLKLVRNPASIRELFLPETPPSKVSLSKTFERWE